jgi:aminoglycoside 3-N-acetyltransferase
MARQLKKKLKQWLRALFAPKVGQAELLQALQQLDIDRHAPLLVHSSLSSFGYVRGGMPAIYQTLVEFIGPQGTLVMPTHSWDQVAKGLRIFDVQETRSCVGAFTEWFRSQPNVVRSMHPTHSVAAYGKDAKDLVSGHETSETPCGKGSPYYKILASNGTILLLGAPLESNTCYHCIEALAGVDYLLQDQPTDFTIEDASGLATERSFVLHRAGVRRELCGLYETLQKAGGQTTRTVGGARVIAIRGGSLLKTGLEILKQNPKALVKA